MGKFNEELVKAGVMLAGEGLQPSSKGARIRFSGEAHRDRRAVRRDQGAGRGLLAHPGQVEGRSDRVDEALPQSRRTRRGEIEIRQVFELEDFGAGRTPRASSRAARSAAGNRRRSKPQAARLVRASRVV